MFDTSKVGHSFPPFTIEMERCKLQELALAIGDDNPIYHSQAAAQEAGYTDIPFAPTAPTVLTFWGNVQFLEQLSGLGIDVAGILHGEESYEYLAMVQPGDVLTGVTTIKDGKSRRTKEG